MCWCLVAVAASEITRFSVLFGSPKSAALPMYPWCWRLVPVTTGSAGKAPTVTWNINTSLWLFFHMSLSRVKADGSLREREGES